MISINADPNYLFNNVTVSSATARSSRCYMNFGGGHILVNHGDYGARDYSATEGIRYYCDDGEFSTSSYGTKSKVSFDCTVSGSNSGCAKIVTCPSSKKLVNFKAGCNLEYGSVNQSQVSAVGNNSIYVFRETDSNSSYGFCSALGGPQVKKGNFKISPYISNQKSFYVSCQEHDKNGGDCSIVGEAYCL
jgi:hypothetical protein